MELTPHVHRRVAKPDARSQLRTLIIGGGVAGLTLAALMRQRGERPLVIERQKSFDDLGYMLGLYYLGSACSMVWAITRSSSPRALTWALTAFETRVATRSRTTP